MKQRKHDEEVPGGAGIAGPLFARSSASFPNRAPIAAGRDPETSHEAAHALTVSGQRGRQKTQVLECLRECRRPHTALIRGVTSAELAAHFGLDRYMVAKRLPDLRDDGMVRNCGKRRCEITGSLAILWEAK